MNRRSFLLAAVVLSPATSGAAAQPSGGRLLRVWRDANCGCCSGWVSHMRASGFLVEDNVVASPTPARRMLGIPGDLMSCHAASVEGYALEGHVPADAVLRLLAERPAAVRGLAVPAMPIGSPGMEMPSEPGEVYDVVAFGASGERTRFMRCRGSQPL